MHAMGWQLVGAAGERFNLQTIKMIQRYASFADGVAFLDGLGDVSLGQSRGLDQTAASGELRGQRRSECTTGTVHVLRLDSVAAQLHHLAAVKHNVHGAFHVPALDNYRW